MEFRVGDRVRNVSPRRVVEPWIMDVGTVISAQATFSGSRLTARTYIVRYDTRPSIWRWFVRRGTGVPVFIEAPEDLELLAPEGGEETADPSRGRVP